MKLNNKHYLIRLDDACPTMDKEKWDKMEILLDKYGIKPMVGIVPNNNDENLVRNVADCKFWEKAKEWQKKGWAIAMHGYDHCYITKTAGINPMWNRSEFAGLPLEKQVEKISRGYEILRNKGLFPKYFFAPSHTFDNNTLEALRDQTDIRVVSDTIGRRPYISNDFLFIPQITGHCVKMLLNGIYTFCFHPNTMNKKAFEDLDDFLKDNYYDFICFDDISISDYGKKQLFDRFLSSAFFTYRQLRGLK